MDYAIRHIRTVDIKRGPIVLFLFKSHRKSFSFIKEITGKETLFRRYEMFDGTFGQTIYLLGEQRQPILIVGLGSPDRIDNRRFSFYGYKSAGFFLNKGYGTLNIVVPKINSINIFNIIRDIFRGAAAANYEINQKKESIALKKIYFVLEKEQFKAKDALNIQKYLLRLTEIQKGIDLAKKLTDMPANDLNPATFIDIVKEKAAQKDLKVKVIKGEELLKKDFPLIYTVGKGSQVEPALVDISVNGADKNCPIIIGKGITFDSGGISLKGPRMLPLMKSDMAAASAVFATSTLCDIIERPFRVLIPLAENLPDGKAYRPGDVIRARNGKRIEIISTDAEGRLILADALSYASELNPQYIVDLATLTGSAMIALGPTAAPFYSNNRGLTTLLKQASERSGDPIWEFPLDLFYIDKLKSHIADLKNSGYRYAGSIVGAAFLSTFVNNSRWAHIDMAGVAYYEERMPWHGEGATGFGVALLVDFLSTILIKNRL